MRAHRSPCFWRSRFMAAGERGRGLRAGGVGWVGMGRGTPSVPLELRRVVRGRRPPALVKDLAEAGPDVRGVEVQVQPVPRPLPRPLHRLVLVLPPGRGRRLREGVPLADPDHLVALPPQLSGPRRPGRTTPAAPSPARATPAAFPPGTAGPRPRPRTGAAWAGAWAGWAWRL